MVCRWISLGTTITSNKINQQYLTFDKIDFIEYTETANTWSDSDCGPMIKMIMPIDGGLNACKDECNNEQNCTAVEFAETTFDADTDCCVLRSCPIPVPTPATVQAEWHTGNFNYSGYASSINLLIS